MRFVVAVLAVLAAISGSGASAQQLITGNQRDAILDAAKGFGSANYETSSNGQVYILGRIDGVKYLIQFNDCNEDRTTCNIIGFRTSFTIDGVTLEKINAWNTNKIFGRAFLSNGRPQVQIDVNVDHGISRRNLEDTIAIWKLVMTQFADHVGFNR